MAKKIALNLPIKFREGVEKRRWLNVVSSIEIIIQAPSIEGEIPEAELVELIKKTIKPECWAYISQPRVVNEEIETAVRILLPDDPGY